MSDEKYRDELSFHMEKKDENTHSLTQQELIEDLKRKKEAALAAERAYRKKFVAEFLLNNGVNPETVDIDAILDGNIPDWYVELKEKAIREIESKKKR